VGPHTVTALLGNFCHIFTAGNAQLVLLPPCEVSSWIKLPESVKTVSLLTPFYSPTESPLRLNPQRQLNQMLPGPPAATEATLAYQAGGHDSIPPLLQRGRVLPRVTPRDTLPFLMASLFNLQ
jgi:hypothetical protein